MRHAADGRYDTVDSLLREVAYETLPRNVRGELHRRAASIVEAPEERARHLDRAARLPHRRPGRRRRGGRGAGPGRPGPLRGRPPPRRAAPARTGRGARVPPSSSVLLDLAKVQALCRRPEDVFETLAMVEDDPDDPTVAIERDHTAANARVFTDPAVALPRARGGHGALARARDRPTKRRGDTPTWASRTST